MIAKVRTGCLVALAALVPVVFDPHTGEVFNIPKLVLVVAGALLLATLFVVEIALSPSTARLTGDLGILLGTYIAWDLVSALFGIDTRLSLLGAYGSYDGVYAAAAFGVVAISVSRLDARALRIVLAALALVAGGMVALYGVIQVHDRLFGGVRWDPVTWGHIPVSNVFSTLGNPNHLAGFIAIALPVVVHFLLRPSASTSGRKLLRISSGVVGAAMVLVLLQTGARGGWLGALAGLGVFALVLFPAIRDRLASFALPAVALVGVSAAVVGLAGSRFLGSKFHHLFAFGASSSVHQRFMLWQASLSMAGHHPLTGAGPDAFSTLFPRFEPASWSKVVGSALVANGAHNLFFNTLADTGIVGLLLLATILLWCGWTSVRISKSLGAQGGAKGARWMLAAVAGGLAAYVVQALFDTQQLAASFCFWLLVGGVGAVASQVGLSPDWLSSRISGRGRPRVVVDNAPGTKASNRERRAASQRERRAQGRRRMNAGALAVVGVAATVYFSIGIDRVWRADHDDWSWRRQTTIAAADASQGQTTAARAEAVAGSTDAEDAISLNPWEPQYPGTFGAQIAAAASGMKAGSTQQYRAYAEANYLLSRAVADSPGDGYWRFVQSKVLIAMSTFPVKSAQADRAQAVELLREAVADDPHNPTYRNYLSTII